MPFHHFPYRLTRHQRRLYLILVAEAKAGELAQAEAPTTMTTNEIAERMGIADVHNMTKALESLQFKLPLVPSRKFRFCCQDIGGKTGGKVTIWWAERKRARGALPEGEKGRLGEGETAE